MMRPLKFTLLAALCAIVAGCAPQAQAPDTDAMLAGAKALDQAFVDAFNNGDAAAVAAMYADSAVMYPPDVMETNGMDAIKGGMAQMFEAMPGARIEMVETHVMPAGDKVIGWGKWRITANGPDGKPMVTDGRYTDVRAERDGKWVYILDHASVPVPPPPGDMK